MPAELAASSSRITLNKQRTGHHYAVPQSPAIPFGQPDTPQEAKLSEQSTHPQFQSPCRRTKYPF
jgi:hypothetical protein